MFKKLLIASAVLAVSSGVAFAGTSYKGEANYKGEPAPCASYTYTAAPYVGFSIGNRTNYSGTPTVFKGIDGVLSAGYAAMLTPDFYLAGEIFVLGTADVKDLQDTVGTTNTSAKSNWGYGVSIIPGYMINDHVLGYVRGGAVRTSFNGSGTNSNITGGQIGVGLQTGIAQNWGVRAEYSYTGYGSVSGPIGNVSSDLVNV